MAVPTCLLETEEDATPYPESLNQSRRRAWKAACVFQALQPRHKGNSLSTIVKTVDVDLERKNYWEDSGEGPTQQDSRSAGTASPVGMSSSLENAASTTEEGESSSTDTAGVAGDGVFSPLSEPHEMGGVLQPLFGHTSCPEIPPFQRVRRHHGVMLG